MIETMEQRALRLLCEGLRKARGETQHSNTFHEFVRRVNPGLLEYEHVPRLIRVGQRIISGELKRVLVMMPPQYFKTEVFSRLLPACFLKERQEDRVGLVSYGADLAWSISEEARNYYLSDGGILRPDAKAKRRWRTQLGGQLWAAGVGGPMLGFGYELGVLDDPTDPEKAHSPHHQLKFREWWPSKFLSRQGPNATIVVVMQRLGIGDPIDFLLRREVGEDTEESPENWHIVICDEIKSNEPLGRWDGPFGLPKTCTVEPDERREGEVLSPSYRSKLEVERIQFTSGPYVTSVQRQQRPSKPQGDFWKREWFQTYDELPAGAFNGGKDWDTAYGENEKNSASAYCESYRGKGNLEDFPIYIEDIDWDWVEFPELIYWMGGRKPHEDVDRRQIKGPHYVEAKASGKSSVQVLKKSGVVASEVQISGDKFARSTGVQPIVSSGRVFVNRRILYKLLDSERMGLLRVRAETLIAGGPDLDVNDVFVAAIHRHTKVNRHLRVYYPGMSTATPSIR